METTLGAHPTAVDVLKGDHDLIRGLFDKFEKAETDLRKKLVGDRCLREIEAHSIMEEEIFYPAVRREMGENALVAQALAEHAAAQRLIDEMRPLPAGERYNVRFRAMREIIIPHFEEEEGVLLVRAEKSGMDGERIGALLLAEKRRFEPSPLGDAGFGDLVALAAAVGAAGAVVWLARRLFRIVRP